MKWRWRFVILAILEGFLALKTGDPEMRSTDPCSDWNLEIPISEITCGASAGKGRRPSQEDNVICRSDVSVPHFPGDATVLGVFDGHGGSAASDIAARCFTKYFVHRLDSFNGSSWKVSVEAALVGALYDSEQAFVKITNGSDIETGTTACIAIIVDGEALVANIGDSKALVCSSGARVTELTSDHHPDRQDEKLRIEASGGYVKQYGGVPRVNGVLAISRSIGDLSFKRYGVTSEPEITGWWNITDQHLVVASDGVFERLSPKEVCTVVEAVRTGRDVAEVLRHRFAMVELPIPLPSSKADVLASPAEHLVDERLIYEDTSLGGDRCGWMNGLYVCVPSVLGSLLKEMADSIMETALNLGSTDNVAVVVYTSKGNAEAHQRAANAIMERGPDVLVETSICYSLVEPLGRESISPFSHTQDGLVTANTSSAQDSLMPENPRSSGKSSSTVVVPLQGGSSVVPAVVPLELNTQDEIYSIPYVNYVSLVQDTESWRSLHIVQDPIDIESRFQFTHYRYSLQKKFARGSFGEIWRAVGRQCPNSTDEKIVFHPLDSTVCLDNDGDVFVLKQILLNTDPTIRLSGLRERHFGQLFLSATQVAGDEGMNHIARFVDSFTRDQDLWLVFRNEGVSLSKRLYVSKNVSVEGSFQMVQPSEFWWWLKSTPEGQEEMRNLLRQLLLAVKACHDRNITHRDIKPENMVVDAAGRMNLWLRIIDFGSAIDPFTLENLYGPSGPSRKEQTMEYAPPEAVFLKHWLHFHPDQLKAYDIWSIGVVMLEMILGTPHVFQISSRTRILLDRRLEGYDQDAKNIAYMLRAFKEMCILFPVAQPRQHEQYKSGPVSNDCSEKALLRKIMQRDPTGLGIQDIWALRLLRRLLEWYPEDRISVDEALRHPYFHPR